MSMCVSRDIYNLLSIVYPVNLYLHTPSDREDDDAAAAAGSLEADDKKNQQSKSNRIQIGNNSSNRDAVCTA